MEEVIGVKFGRLTILDIEPQVKGKSKRVKAVCECGKIKTYRLCHLKSSETQSCGCLRTERVQEALITHGMTKSIEYKCYMKIKERCLDENCKSFKEYGAKGILMCDRWVESFENFYEDMGPRPSLKYSVDRIDNSKGYSKNNCRWATASLQGFNQNKRHDNKSGRTGVMFRRGRWLATIGYSNKKINLGSFVEFDDAVKARETAELKYYGYIKQ